MHHHSKLRHTDTDTHSYLSAHILYSGLFSKGKIFANFMNQKQSVKILPSKCLLFNRYFLQSVTIYQNFPLDKLGIAQFMKIFPFKNNPLYSIQCTYTHMHAHTHTHARTHTHTPTHAHTCTHKPLSDTASLQ